MEKIIKILSIIDIVLVSFLLGGYAFSFSYNVKPVETGNVLLATSILILSLIAIFSYKEE